MYVGTVKRVVNSVKAQFAKGTVVKYNKCADIHRLEQSDFMKSGHGNAVSHGQHTAGRNTDALIIQVWTAVQKAGNQFGVARFAAVMNQKTIALGEAVWAYYSD